MAKLGKVAVGIDPFKDFGSATETFSGEVARYLERKRGVMKARSFEEVQRHLTNHSGALARLRLSEIDRRTIAVRLGQIEQKSGPVARNRVRSSLSAFFAWAVTEGLLETNPVAGTAKLNEGGSRERVLTDAELARVLRACGEDQFGDIVRLLALTGQRREEIGALRWSEVDFDRGLIALPPDRTKNRRQHDVPLSPLVRTILQRQPHRGERELIFGIGKGPFSGWSDCKAALDQRVTEAADAELAGWRLHDLRRTVATGMADRLGVLPHIVEAVLNHVSGHRAGVAGIYNRARYETEMRDALVRWSEHVAALIA